MRILPSIRCFIVALILLTFSQTFAQKKKEEFLISIYSPPPAKFLNDDQYQVLKDAHVDILLNIGPGVKNDKEGNLQTLDLARKYGFKVYVFDGRLSGSDEKIQEMVSDYRAHPALGGYYITDEPDSARLKSAVDVMSKVKKLDPQKDAYINHLPDWAVNNYEHEFLERYIQLAGKENINYLAYDNYPYKRKQKLEKTYFNNLEIIRRVGLKYNIKTSSCLQSFGMYFSGVEELRRPNADEIRMNVYSNLAYGIKNPVWYPYWTQDNMSSITVSLCVIDSAGVKTDMYEPFRQMNGEMKQLGKTLINLDAQEVYHTGDSLWVGTVRPPAGFIFKIQDEKADFILSRLVEKTSEKEYVMVVNRSFKQPRQMTFQVKDSVKKIKEISKINGKPERSKFVFETHQITESFLPGEGKLFQIN